MGGTWKSVEWRHSHGNAWKRPNRDDSSTSTKQKGRSRRLLPTAGTPQCQQIVICTCDNSWGEPPRATLRFSGRRFAIPHNNEQGKNTANGNMPVINTSYGMQKAGRALYGKTEVRPPKQGPNGVVSACKWSVHLSALARSLSQGLSGKKKETNVSVDNERRTDPNITQTGYPPPPNPSALNSLARPPISINTCRLHGINADLLYACCNAWHQRRLKK